MQQSSESFTHQSESSMRRFYQGAWDIMPLSVAVLPWGILAGSMAVNAGLSTAQAFAMSSVVFAGAAQLVSLGLVMSDASVWTMFITVFFLTSQHLIYALSFRPQVQKFPLRKRLGIGFLLTDELFAVGMNHPEKRCFAYLFGAGLCFYLAWCLFSLMGIVLAKAVPDLSSLHLDFSIVAVFVLIIVPMVKNHATLAAVCVTAASALIFRKYQIEAGTVLSGLIGMLTGVCASGVWKVKQ